MSEEEKLLLEAHKVLAEYWFDQENNDYNNDDVITMDKKIISYLEKKGHKLWT